MNRQATGPARTSGWIALYTKQNQEETALINIERQGFEAYCPRVSRSQGRRAGQSGKDHRPLFPSYVFVRIDDRSTFQWRPLMSTYGVRTVVRFADRLGFLPRGFVEELKTRERSGALETWAAPRFERGMRVKLDDGPFRALIAEVLSLPENNRIWLLLEVMGRQVRIQHEASAIVAA